MTASQLCAISAPLTCAYHAALQAKQRAEAVFDLEGYRLAANEVERLEQSPYFDHAIGDFLPADLPVVVGVKSSTSSELVAMANQLALTLPSRFQQWHAQAPGDVQLIKDKVAESYLASALRESYADVVYTSGSHTPGADIVVGNPTNTTDRWGISCKSGSTRVAKSTDTRWLEFSSSRSTEHATMAAKINFFKSHEPKFYIAVSHRKVVTEASLPNITNFVYTIYLFDGSVVDFGTPEAWQSTANGARRSTGDLTLDLRKNMSDQLWVDLNTSQAGIISFDIPIRLR